MDTRNRRPFKYSVWQMVKMVTILVVAMALLRIAVDKLDGNYDEVTSALSSNPRIVDLAITSEQEDLETNVYSCTFRLAGRPDSFVSLMCPSEGFVRGNDGVTIHKIGDISLNVRYIDEKGFPRGGGGVHTGADGKLRDMLPCTVDGLEELLDRYDELLEGFGRWPTQDAAGVVKLPNGWKAYYYAIGPDTP